MAYGEQSQLKALVMRNLYRRSRLDARYQIVFACFLATFIMYLERMGFTIAWGEMVKQAEINEDVQGQVLAAFYWGYISSQVLGGWLAQRCGGKPVLACSFALWSLGSFLTPHSGKHKLRMNGVRIFIGAAQGLIIPSTHTLLAQWIPPQERAKAVSLTTSGMYMGSAAATVVFPSLAARRGPHIIPQCVGLIGLLWLALWLPFGKNAPRQAYIPVASTQRRSTASRPRSPCVRMLRHSAVWAIIVNNFTFHFAFYVVMSWTPKYFEKIMHVDMKDAGAAGTLPYLAMFACSNLGGWAGDHLISQRGYRVAAARKAINTVGFWGTSLALMAMPAARSLHGGTFAMTATLGMAAFSRGGFSVNHMDIAPAHAGVLMGLSNSAGTLSGIIGNRFTGGMLHRYSGVAGWWASFLLCAAQCFAGSMLFITCARGERIFGESV